MIRHHPWKRVVARAKLRGARSLFLPFAAVFLAVAAAVALVPRGISFASATASPTPVATPATAPNDGGVTWNPNGNAVQENDGAVCDISDGGTFTGTSAPAMTKLAAVLNVVPPMTVNQNGNITSLDHISQSGTTVTAGADVSVACSIVNQTAAYVKRAGFGSVGQFAQTVTDARLHPAQPGTPAYARQHAALLDFTSVNWLRAAIGAVVGVMTFLSVAAIVVSGLGALAAAVGVAELSVAVLAGISGCIAGAIATPIAVLTATGSLSGTAALGATIDGCIGGAALGAITGVLAGYWLAGILENLGWVTASAAADVAGPALEADAAAAAVDLTGIQTETDSAVVALRNYPG